MELRRDTDMPYGVFPEFSAQQGLTHAVLTRGGGCSRGPFSRLNLAFNIGDEDRSVRRNRQTIEHFFPGRAHVYARQVHGTDILVFHPKRQPLPAGGQTAETGDAMISSLPGIRLIIQVADCQAILLFDPRQRVVANIHAGWRGSIANIIGKTIAAMQRVFDSQPKQLLAAIGPSLGPCCAQFVNYRREIPDRYWRYKDYRDHFDFWALSRDQLRQSGVSGKHISISRLCTRCHHDVFFSYRHRNTTGRFGVLIGLD